MTMTTKNNENRTGIYVQESAGVATAGDGLDPQGYKSPVTQQYNDSDNSQNQEKNPSYGINPFKRSTSQLSSIDLEGSESDTNDGKPHRQHKFRMQRYQEMKNEFLKLGFSNQEIRAMQEALEAERKQRHNQNKVIRYCEEKQVDPESAKQSWVERKERELAKYRAEKAAKIAAGTFNPIPFRERKRKRDRERSSQGSGSSGNLSGQFNIPERIDQSKIINFENQKPPNSKLILVSPAIIAGVREQDSPCSVANKRKTALLAKQMEFGRAKDFEEVRERMGLIGPHISRRYSSDSLPDTQVCSNDPEKQSFNSLEARYPIEVQILNKSHPFGEVPEEMKFLILDALETTIADERARGSPWIKTSPGRYIYRRLHVNCRNIHTVKFLESQIPLYNRLWRGADLFLTREIIMYKRAKYRVNIPNYNLTSDEFFKIIKKQNGFPTEYWTLYHKARENDRFRAFFSVDPETDKQLESNGFVYFFFDKIQFTLHEKINKKELSQ